MLYCGVHLFAESCKITVLTYGFAYLDTKYFAADKYAALRQWVNAFLANQTEECAWIFDEVNYHAFAKNAALFGYIEQQHVIYLVNHRKLVNFRQFMFEWIVQTESLYLAEMDQTYILASALRLFDMDELQTQKMTHVLAM